MAGETACHLVLPAAGRPLGEQLVGSGHSMEPVPGCRLPCLLHAAAASKALPFSSGSGPRWLGRRLHLLLLVWVEAQRQALVGSGH